MYVFFYSCAWLFPALVTVVDDSLIHACDLSAALRNFTNQRTLIDVILLPCRVLEMKAKVSVSSSLCASNSESVFQESALIKLDVQLNELYRDVLQRLKTPQITGSKIDQAIEQLEELLGLYSAQAMSLKEAAIRAKTLISCSELCFEEFSGGCYSQRSINASAASSPECLCVCVCFW